VCGRRDNRAGGALAAGGMSCGGGGHGRGGSRADITHARRLAETGRATVQPLTAPSDPHLRVRVTGRVGSSARPASGRVSSRPSRSWGVLAWRIAAQTRSQPSRVGGLGAGDGDPGAHGRGVRVKGAIGGGERGRGRARGGDRWRRGAPVCRRRLLARRSVGAGCWRAGLSAQAAGAWCPPCASVSCKKDSTHTGTPIYRYASTSAARAVGRGAEPEMELGLFDH